MIDFEYLITHYGLLAILIGTFFEGEAILIIGGFMAHQGYLAIYEVIAAAFIGGMSGDQLYFYIGRRKGRNLASQRPGFAQKIQRIQHYLEKYQSFFVITFRFIYGIRTLTPFILGTTSISTTRFFILNAIGAILWAVTISLAGYYLGHHLEKMLGELKKYELLIIGILGCSWLIYLLIHSIIKRYKKPVNQVG